MTESGVMHQHVEENRHKTLREENVIDPFQEKNFVLKVNIPLSSEIIFRYINLLINSECFS